MKRFFAFLLAIVMIAPFFTHTVAYATDDEITLEQAKKVFPDMGAHSSDDSLLGQYSELSYFTVKSFETSDNFEWSEWSEWSTEKPTESDTVDVESKTQYGYYHYILQYSDGKCGAYPIDSSTFNSIFPNYPTTQKDYHTEYFDSQLSKIETLTYDKAYDCYANNCCPDKYDYDNGSNASYFYYLGTRTVYRSRTKISSEISVTGVFLNKSAVSLSVGEEETLVAAIMPFDATNKAVVWSSSDPSVVKVRNGVITALSAGTTEITVTTEDGNKTSTCTVTALCTDGDVNGDSLVEAADAINLLYHVFFGSDRYPVNQNQNCDFDGNGKVEAADAIYLLYHVFFGTERYPLYPSQPLPAVLVTDAVNFKCPIISDYDFADYYSCKFYIPKLNYETENSKAFNEKIYNEFSETYEFFKDYTESGGYDDSYTDRVYYIGYDCKIYNNFIAVAITQSEAPIGASWSVSKERVYYYDCNKDEELTFEEYLNVFGYTKDEAESLLITMEDKHGWDSHTFISSNSILENCLIDSESTIVYFSNIRHDADIMDYWPGDENYVLSYEVDSIIKAEMSNKLSAEETADYWERFYNENKGDFLSVMGRCLREHYTDDSDLNCYIEGIKPDANAFVVDFDNDKMPELCVVFDLDDQTLAEHLVTVLEFMGSDIICADLFASYELIPPYNDISHNIYIDSSGNICLVFQHSSFRDSGFSVTLNGEVIRNLAVSGEWYDYGNGNSGNKYTISSTEFDTVVVYDEEKETVTAPHWEWLEKLSESFIDYETVGFFDVWNKQCNLRK